MRVWESRSPPAYRTTSDEPVSSEVVSILCFSLAEFRRVLKSSQISRRVLRARRFRRFRRFLMARRFRELFYRSQISRISQILGCFLRKMRVQRGVFPAFSREIRENVTFSSEINNNYPPRLWLLTFESYFCSAKLSRGKNNSLNN